MYKTNRQLRQDARQALSGKWGTALLILILSGLLSLIVSSVFVDIPILGMLSSLLSVILNVGFFSFLLKLCCGQKSSAVVADLFYGFKCHPGKAVLLYLLTILYTLPGSIIYAVLLTVFVFVSFYDMNINYINPAALVCCILVCLVLTLLFMAYAFYIDATYGMVYFLLLDYPDLPVNEIWRRSKQLMTGHRRQYVFLQLSFMCPLLIPAALFGVSLIYVLDSLAYTAPFALLLLTASSLFFMVLSVWLKIWSYTSTAAMYLNLVHNQGMKTAASAVPNQAYTAVPPVAEEDCTEEHSDLHRTNGTDYSGIDPDTFK